MDNIYDVNGDVIHITDDGDVSTARKNLSGKVVISLGDSYTYQMASLFSNLSLKYEMVHDGRGIVGSSICAKNGYTAPMYNRVDTIVSDYSSGYEINGQTYYKDDVAIITFMGGANDGVSVIGDGLKNTESNTIYGALHHIFSTLQENFTKAVIICVTQPSNYSLVVANQITSDAIAQNYFKFDSMAQALVLDDVQFSNYCMCLKEDAVRNMATCYELPIIDMFYGFPSVFNPTNRATYWNSDKLHLTGAGYDYIITAIDEKIIELFGKKRIVS